MLPRSLSVTANPKISYDLNVLTLSYVIWSTFSGYMLTILAKFLILVLEFKVLYFETL